MTHNKVTITVSGAHGEVMRMERTLPLCVLNRMRELVAEIDELHKLHDMTLAKRKMVDMARVLGRSPNWIRDRQKDLGLK